MKDTHTFVALSRGGFIIFFATQKIRDSMVCSD